MTVHSGNQSHKLKITERVQHVFTQVEMLYQNSSRDMGRWMWENHVQWVAGKSKELALKYGAKGDLVVVGALLHDLGDVRYERTEDKHELWGDEKTREILQTAGFANAEVDKIVKHIISPHSCYPDNMPKIIEGKILATADAVFHLQTDFFAQVCWMHLPPWKESFAEWKSWVGEKLERDLNSKIFFDDEKEECKPYYDAIKLVFDID